MPENIDLQNLSAYLEKFPWLDLEYFGNTVAHYLTVVGVVMLIYVLAKAISLGLERYAKHLTSRTSNKLDDMVVSTIHRSVTFILVLGALYFGIKSLNVPESVDVFAAKAIFILFTLKIAKEFEIFIKQPVI